MKRLLVLSVLLMGAQAHACFNCKAYLRNKIDAYFYNKVEHMWKEAYSALEECNKQPLNDKLFKEWEAKEGRAFLWSYLYGGFNTQYLEPEIRDDLKSIGRSRVQMRRYIYTTRKQQQIHIES